MGEAVLRVLGAVVVVVGAGKMGQAELGVVEWARGSFGAHGPSQGRISATGCFGNTGPEKRAFVQRLFL